MQFTEYGRRLACLSLKEAAEIETVLKIQLFRDLLNLEIGGAEQPFRLGDEQVVAVLLRRAAELFAEFLEEEGAGHSAPPRELRRVQL